MTHLPCRGTHGGSLGADGGSGHLAREACGGWSGRSLVGPVGRVGAAAVSRVGPAAAAIPGGPAAAVTPGGPSLPR
ncbi:hypothetical protein [Streptomyces sp. NPDC056480]|uniref:hypothetical protein n=1 Tax=Streptomyces sp. NPDC056480 TaxID=3345833 RepID=UPI0036CA9EE8